MQIVTTWNKQASVVKNTDIIITNYAPIKQKEAKITCLCDFCFLLFFCFTFFPLFAIWHGLGSHFKNSCFVFYRCFQTLKNISFLYLETPVKHSQLFWNITSTLRRIWPWIRGWRGYYSLLLTLTLNQQRSFLWDNSQQYFTGQTALQWSTGCHSQSSRNRTARNCSRLISV